MVLWNRRRRTRDRKTLEVAHVRTDRRIVQADPDIDAELVRQVKHDFVGGQEEGNLLVIQRQPMNRLFGP